MKKTIILAATLALSSGTAVVGAGIGNIVVGSDTLELMTDTILANCPGATGLDYQGPGSTQGENNIRDQKAAISPMSRVLAANNACLSNTNPDNPAPNTDRSKAAGQTMAADAIVVTVDSENTQCGTTPELSRGEAILNVAGCTAGLGCVDSDADGTADDYVMADWKEPLRLVYGGAHHNTVTGCSSKGKACTTGADCAAANGGPGGSCQTSGVAAGFCGTSATTLTPVLDEVACTTTADCAPRNAGLCDAVAGKCSIKLNPDTCVSAKIGACTGGAVAAGVQTGGSCSVKGPVDCNSPVRKALVSNLSSLYQGECAAGTCDGLKKAYRRGDLSGTTNVFLGFIGMSLVAQQPFCNGTDYEDKDPVRIACDANDDVCSNRDFFPANAQDQAGKFNGLVLAVHSASNLTNDQNYPTEACDKAGVFKLAQPHLRNKVSDPGVCRNNQAVSCTTATDCVAYGVGGTCKTEFCPDSRPTKGGLCRAPVRTNPANPAGNLFDCTNWENNRSPLQGVRESGRVYNNYSYSGPGILLKDDGARTITGAKHRMRSAKGVCATSPQRRCSTDAQCGTFGPCTLGTTACRETSATLQLGCLTDKDPCAWGWAGYESDALFPGNKALVVNNTIPGNLNYVMARNLFVNTMIGFENTATYNPGGALENELLKCMSDQTKLDAAAVSAGYFPLPIQCVDFNETACGAASNNNACAESTPALCADTLDNDADGKVDCADETCKRFPACN